MLGQPELLPAVGVLRLFLRFQREGTSHGQSDDRMESHRPLLGLPCTRLVTILVTKLQLAGTSVQPTRDDRQLRASDAPLAAGRSNTSRTFCSKSPELNGFGMNGMPGSK